MTRVLAYRRHIGTTQAAPSAWLSTRCLRTGCRRECSGTIVSLNSCRTGPSAAKNQAHGHARDCCAHALGACLHHRCTCSHFIARCAVLCQRNYRLHFHSRLSQTMRARVANQPPPDRCVLSAETTPPPASAVRDLDALVKRRLRDRKETHTRFDPPLHPLEQFYGALNPGHCKDADTFSPYATTAAKTLDETAQRCSHVEVLLDP
jgi:hypothetical protein